MLYISPGSEFHVYNEKKGGGKKKGKKTTTKTPTIVSRYFSP